jgi:outer membrane protein assembly factor BamE
MLCAALLAAGCASESLKNYVPNIVTPYRMDIQQGNFVTQDMVDKLQVGQSRDQVRFILGTPLLTDVFHADRWDYIFRYSKGWNDPEKHLLTVHFENDKLARWEASVPPPKSDTPESLARAQAAAEQQKPGFFKRLFSWGKSAEPAAVPAAAPASPAAPTVPATPAVSETPAVPPAAPTPAAAPWPAVAPPAPAEAPAVAAAPAAAPAAEASKPAAPPPPAAQPAGAIGAAEQPPEQKPGLMSRLFGWMKSAGGSAEATAAASRAASPDPEPQPIDRSSPPAPPLPVETPPVPTPEPAIGAAVADAAPAPAAASLPAPTPASAARPGGDSASLQDVLGALEHWRAAWESKDAAAYLAAYAPDFKPGGGLSRAKWEAQRRERLEKPAFIAVKVLDPQVTLDKGDAAAAVFVQQYESNLFKESGRKTLTFGLYGGKWLIRDESVLVQGAALVPGLAPLVAAPGAARGGQ